MMTAMVDTADMSPAAPEKSRHRLITWITIGFVALILLGVGGVLLYTKVINDAPDAGIVRRYVGDH